MTKISGHVQDHLPPNLLPTPLKRAGFIAGGYAAHPDLATDIDVWVQVKPGELHSERRRILTHLSAQHFDLFCEKVDTEESFVGDMLGYEDITANILKVAVIQRGNQRPIHIMVTDAPPLMLILNFDISTHQIALTDSGVMRGPEWTDTDEEPVIIKNHTTLKTQERFAKISARYAHLRKAA